MLEIKFTFDADQTVALLPDLMPLLARRAAPAPAAASPAITAVVEQLAAPAPAEPPAPPPPPAPLTAVEARRVLTRLNDERGHDVAKALVAEFGVKRVTDVDPDRLAELIEKAEALLA